MRFLKNIRLSLITIAVLIYGSPALAEMGLNMHRGVTPLSHDIFDLHMTIFWICVAIGIIVYGFMVYAIIYHRKSRGAVAAQFHENTYVEVIWAIIPLLILIIMAIPATKVLMKMENFEDSEVTIKITGYQWKWEYEYLNQGVKFFSLLSTPHDQLANEVPKGKWYLLEVDKPMVVPIHKKIRFLITSNDVIHSWWVPDLGVKKDAVPGFIHEAWARIEKTGTYRGQCAELCGVGHGFMPIVVEAKTEEDFNKWVEEQHKAKRAEKAQISKDYSMEELLKIGQISYDKFCSVCHQADGMGISPVFPAMKANSVAVGRPISRHINIVLHGVPGTAMQSFAPQMSDLDIAAIVTYERNAWGNNTGDMIQPAVVQALRNKTDSKGEK